VQLVPIPTTPAYLNATFELWSPFLPDIARRSPWSIEELLTKLCRHEVQPILVFEGSAPVVLIGTRIVQDDNGDRVGVVEWLTFNRDYGYRASRASILADLESYLRDHVKCKKCRPIVLPGWRKFLAAHGYTLVRPDTDNRHIIMEKVL
jgi:hypothetical protein